MAELIQQNEHLSFGLGSVAAFRIDGSKETHTQATIKAPLGKIAIWGDDNMYPERYMKVFKNNGAAGSSFRFNRAAHYGQGFKLWRMDTTDDGKEDRQIVPINSLPVISKFFKENQLQRVYNEVIADLELWNIGWPEYILSNDYNTITSVRRYQTYKMRFEVINPKSGLVENSYFSHNWTSGLKEDSEFVQKTPVIDSYASAEQVKEYCKKNKIHKFMMPIFYPLIDETYYPEPEQHSVFRNGWMDVVNAIPQYKKHFSENQLNVKYMVYISEEYFLRTYLNEWENFTPERKQEIRKGLTTSIDEHLAGNKNAGKSIQSTVFKDKDNQWVKGIEVQPLKDENSSEGKGLLDSSAGNSEIMSAWNVDPSLMGVGIPGGKMNSGGGSDKREAFDIVNSLFKSKRDITLQMWRFLRDYNEWDEDLEGDFAITELTTLDKNPTGTETKF